MATSFKQFNPRKTVTGPGRLGVSDEVITSDPTVMKSVTTPSVKQGIMDPTDFTFETPFEDVGATSGGITISRGFTTQDYTVDQSDGPFKSEVTSTVINVSTNLAELGNLESFVLLWLADDATASVSTTKERVKGLGTIKAIPHRSLALVHIDEDDLIRAYFLRDVANSAGNMNIGLAPGSLHTLPLALQAYADTTKAAGFEFGFIMEQNGFGGQVDA